MSGEPDDAPPAPAFAARELLLQTAANDASSLKVLRALASEPRLRILELLSDNHLNISEVAQTLALPLSTATLHVGILEDAGLIVSARKPAVRGSQKVCTRAFDTLHVRLPQRRSEISEILELSMPVGAYTDVRVTPTCGLAGGEGIIGLFDDPTSFYEAERLSAQLLWFHRGYVEYRFPNRIPAGARVESVQVRLEVCSGAPLHHSTHPSDITLWLNGIELGTWTAPADFGGARGALTPAWWEPYTPQYGLLKVWQVTAEGSFIDGLRLGGIATEALRLEGERAIAVRLGIKEGAHNVGGLSLFGRGFGNYPQDIVLRVRYS